MIRALLRSLARPGPRRFVAFVVLAAFALVVVVGAAHAGHAGDADHHDDHDCGVCAAIALIGTSEAFVLPQVVVVRGVTESLPPAERSAPLSFELSRIHAARGPPSPA